MVFLTVSGQTDAGLVRAANEDAYVIADLTGGALLAGVGVGQFEVGERGVLLAVSDGMGGQRAGEVASALVIESLRRTMTAQRTSLPGIAKIETAVAAANGEVFTASKTPGQEKMGATLTAVFVQGTCLYIAEVGDSRAYLLRGGELVQVTRDQSYVQLLVDSGALTPEEAEFAPTKNIILQAMGQKAEVTVALGRLELRMNDCFLICSDGLSNEVTLDEMRRVMSTTPDATAACATLVGMARAHGGADNITVIVGGVTGDLTPLAAGETVAQALQVVREYAAPAPAA